MFFCLLVVFLLFFACGVLPPTELYIIGTVVAWAMAVIAWYIFGKRSSIVCGLVLLIISSLVCLVVGDLALRRFLTGSIYYRPDERLLEESSIWPEVFRFKKNRRLIQQSWGDLANFTCASDNQENKVTEFITDEYGFRNERGSLHSPPEIIVLGDSFADGSGTTQHKIFSNLLAAKLNKGVYNLGLPGTPWEEVRNLLMESPHLALTGSTVLIWMLFEGNDLDDYRIRDEVTVPVKRNSWEQWRFSLQKFQSESPIRKLVSALWRGCPTKEYVAEFSDSRLGSVLFYRDYIKVMHYSRSQILELRGWKNMQYAFKAMRSLVSAYGFRVVVVLAPSKEEIYLQPDEERSQLANLLENEAQESKFEFIDLRPQLVRGAINLSQTQSLLLWWKDDTHWNEEGHQLVADVLSEYLSK